jgi:uncharacterized RDD family membrane protein YckC
MSDLPTYPEEAAQREEAQLPVETGRQLSGWWRRAGAYILDSIVSFIGIIVIFAVGFGLAAVISSDAIAGIIAVIAVVAGIGFPIWYFTYFTGNEQGQTIGKRALGIRVRSDETGGPIGYGRAFGRYAITVVFGFVFIPWVLDYLWPLWDGKNQTLHDKIVGSVVERAV